jgi:hypothetical protein
MHYRLTYGDGWYRDKDGRRKYFPLQPHLRGIDLTRQCTLVSMRAAILLAVMGGIGLRAVCWLLRMLFHLDVSKSTLDRWIKECGAQLPEAREIARMLNADKPITEAHFDEIFAKGRRPKRCTLILRDEHGRIFAKQEVVDRDEKTIATFLQQVKDWGLSIQSFYVDGCKAYRKAIAEVFPHAAIQYDYFHVIQSVFRKLRQAFVSHRKDLRARSKASQTPAYSARLADFATRLWENRGLIFKNPQNMSTEERQTLHAIIEEDRFVGKMRRFMGRVWGIFQDSKTERGAIQRLQYLKRLPEVQREPNSAFAKAVEFLGERFSDMTAFLRYATVRRNSLAETGIRCLRRLERGHDGFRGPEGLDCYVRIYQTIKYLDWDVHRTTQGLGLPRGPTGRYAAALAPSAN